MTINFLNSSIVLFLIRVIAVFTNPQTNQGQGEKCSLFPNNFSKQSRDESTLRIKCLCFKYFLTYTFLWFKKFYGLTHWSSPHQSICMCWSLIDIRKCGVSPGNSQRCFSNTLQCKCNQFLCFCEQAACQRQLLSILNITWPHAALTSFHLSHTAIKVVS